MCSDWICRLVLTGMIFLGAFQIKGLQQEVRDLKGASQEMELILKMHKHDREGDFRLYRMEDVGGREL